MALDASLLDFSFARMPGDELHDYLRRLRARGPVHPCLFSGQPAMILTSHAAVAAAFKDNALFPPANANRILIEPVQGLTFQTMEDEEHRIYRRLATPAFRSRAVEKMEVEGLARIAHELIDKFPSGGCDMAHHFSHRYAFLVISRMLGIPLDHEEQFREWAKGFLSFPADPVYAAECADKITEYVTPILAQRRADPQDDIISGLIQADADGVRLTDEDIIANFRLLFAAGASTTTDAIGNLLYVLLTQPDLWETLRKQPDLRANAIEELLRWETPVAILPRISAPEPIEFQGVAIPANTFCLFAMASANRDPAVFPDPERFDIARDSGHKLLSFGPGPRLCPGMHLARKQLAVVLDVLLERLPALTLTDEEAARPCGTMLRGPEVLPVTY